MHHPDETGPPESRNQPGPAPAPSSTSLTSSIGDRSVAIGGDATGATIKTGDEYHLPPEALDRFLPPAYDPPEPPPIDALPDSGDLPPGYRMPFLPNPQFTGRERDLKDLAQALLYQQDGSKAVGIVGKPVAAAATGLGGVGKTQLAVEFCYRYGHYFRGVHWVQADLDILQEIAACGLNMGIKPWPGAEPEQVQATLLAWQVGGGRLVVLDNLEDVVILQEWLPRLAGSRVLVTSRRREWPDFVEMEAHALGMLSRAESRTLLRKLAPHLAAHSDESLDRIADRLGDLPLALDLAGRYLADNDDLAPEGYLAELDEEEDSALEHISLLDWTEDNPTRHETSLAETFLVSWRRLSAEAGKDRLARAVFKACGYCAPNTPIPEALLVQAVADQEAKSRQVIRQALKRLYRLGLLEDARGGPKIHPLSADFARAQDRIAPESLLSGLASALGNLAEAANETGLPSNFTPLRPHVRVLAETAAKRELETAGLLWNELGYHFRQIAEYAEARAAYERALRIDAATYGSDHTKVAVRLNNLGMVLKELGDPSEAQVAYERALEIFERNLGSDHPNVATLVNNLGAVLQELGDLSGAQAAYERALRIDAVAYGPDHPKIAIRVNNLGMLLKAQGDLSGARAAFERALRIDEAAYGPDHPEVATVVNNLGLVLQDLGDLSGARAAYQRALAIDEAAFGPDHPKVANDVNNLGSVLQAQGDLNGARAAYERALKILGVFLPPDHPNIQIIRNNLVALDG